LLELFRYAAFISYSSKDAAFARRLHLTLEGYRIPASLGEFKLTDHPRAKNRLYPCFRDREELASGHLGPAIEKALDDSSALIVVCSPNASDSPWVEKEIRYFESSRPTRIFAIIADGEPNASEHGDEGRECFPPAFRHAARKRAGEAPPEFVAGDARKGKDGWRNAWLKLVAGIIGEQLGKLTNRDAEARRKRALVFSVGGVALTAALLAILASIDDQAGRQALYEHGRRLVEREVLTSQVVVRQPNPSDEELIAIGADPMAPARFLLAAMRDRSNLLPGAAGAETALRQTPAGVSPVALLGTVTRFAFSHDGARLLTKDGDGAYTLRDGVTGRAIQALGVLGRDQLLRDDPWFHAFDFTDDARRLLTRDPDGIWRLRDGATGAVIAAMATNEDYAAFLPGSARAISITGNTYLLRNANDGRAIRPLGALRDLLPSSDGKRLVAVRPNNSAALLDGLTGAQVTSLGGVTNLGPVAHFSGDDATVLISGADRSNIVYDAQTGVPVTEFGQYGRYFLVQRAPHGPRMLTMAVNGSYELRETPSARPLATFTEVLDLEFSLDGTRVRKRSRANDTMIYDAQTGVRIDRIKGFVIGVSPTLERVVTYERDERSHSLRDPVSDAVLARLGARVERAEFSPDGALLMLVGQRSTMELHDGRTGALLFAAGAATDAKFSPDGGNIMLSSASRQAVLYHVGQRYTDSGAALRGAVCGASGDAIGSFSDAARRLSADASDRAIAERLRGRPRNPCDWRGLLSLDGWAQMLRYWAVRLGANWDYGEQECAGVQGFGCPG
jgi:WD40 repeat protein